MIRAAGSECRSDFRRLPAHAPAVRSLPLAIARKMRSRASTSPEPPTPAFGPLPCTPVGLGRVVYGRERRLNLVKRSDHCHRSIFNAGGATSKLHATDMPVASVD